MRELLLSALGSFRDPQLAAASLDLLLSKDFDLRESFYPLLFGPLAYAETRDVPFTFVKQHLDALLKRLPREVGEDYAATLPYGRRRAFATSSAATNWTPSFAIA